MVSDYRIIDEPRRRRFQLDPVNPRWIVAATVFCGPWLAWPWAVLNGHALGRPIFRREVPLVIGGFAGAVILGLGVIWLSITYIAPPWSRGYLLIAVAMWKVGVGLVLNVVQLEAFEIYRYCGGAVRRDRLLAIVVKLIIGILVGFVIYLGAGPVWDVLFGSVIGSTNPRIFDLT